jgi:hypothetical protein
MYAGPLEFVSQFLLLSSYKVVLNANCMVLGTSKVTAHLVSTEMTRIKVLTVRDN